jgi:hypothetical protein
MLHKSDISVEALKSLRRPSEGAAGARPKALLEKNTPVTVYVKHVFKQSG